MWNEIKMFFQTFFDHEDDSDLENLKEPVELMSAGEAKKVSESNYKARGEDWRRDLRNLVINEISLSIGLGKYSACIELHAVDKYNGLLLYLSKDQQQVYINHARSVSDELVEMGYKSEVIGNSIRISWNKE